MNAKKKTSRIAPADRVPVAQKAAYGAGCLVNMLAGNITIEMFNPVFNIALGISPVTLGFVLMIFRLWDAVTDVVMGNISDNARTRWGRRRPFIVVGAILAGLIVPLFWNASPEWSRNTILGYVIIIGILLYTAVTIWGMPYYSLGMEMTPDYNERTRICAVRTVFSKIGGLIGGWLIALASLKIFANPETGAPDLANGMRHISWGLGLLVILFGVLPGIFVKERYYQKDARKQPRIPFWKSLKMTLSCRPFMLLMPIYLLQVVGSGMVASLGLYLNIYYVCKGNLQLAGTIAGLQSTAMMVLGILTVPMWAWISEKLGKRVALGLTIAFGFITNMLIYVCFNPAYPYLQIVPSIFLSAFGSAIWMLIPSMQADIADYDELENNERREGSFSAVSSWFYKMAITLTAGVSGVILVWTGFDVVKYGVAQPPDVLKTMLNWYVFLPVVCWTVALLLLHRYPLTQKIMGEIRVKLEARRGVV
jgi:GPH family glycoside/pentoside/hexuronide:cation symporter